LLLVRCGISDPGGFPTSDTIADVVSGLPHDDSSGQDGLPDPPNVIITGVDSGDPPSDNTNGQDGPLNPPTDNTDVDSGQPHDGDTNGDVDLPDPFHQNPPPP
ncbi:hypothetical protein PRIPAC_70389, partial [Pristionchus pacificus]